MSSKYICNSCSGTWNIDSRHHVKVEPENFKDEPEFTDKANAATNVCPYCGSLDTSIMYGNSRQ